jgi:hypothetical protein
VVPLQVALCAMIPPSDSCETRRSSRYVAARAAHRPEGDARRFRQDENAVACGSYPPIRT